MESTGQPTGNSFFVYASSFSIPSSSLTVKKKKEKHNEISSEPRWPSGLRRWFANATPRGTGFRIPPLPRAASAKGRVWPAHSWSDIIGSSLQGRGEDSASTEAALH